jgi:predicted metal-binding protein
MRIKVVHISSCHQCPNFDNEYWGYEEICRKLNRKIKRVKKKEGDNYVSDKYPIPKDCPLEDKGT